MVKQKVLVILQLAVGVIFLCDGIIGMIFSEASFTERLLANYTSIGVGILGLSVGLFDKRGKK